MNSNCLPANSKHVIKRVSKIIDGYDFILAGGTALALQLGHRISVDLDFFSSRLFETNKFFKKLCDTGSKVQIQDESKGTLYVVIDGVKLSFLYYPYPFVEKTIKWQKIDLANILDIAGMKIIAIIQRGAKRDFVDLYFILQNVPFWKIADNIINRYGKNRINPVSFGKGVVFFDDAETDPDPEYCSKIKPSWKEVKRFFINHVKQLVFDLQAAKFNKHLQYI